MWVWYMNKHIYTIIWVSPKRGRRVSSQGNLFFFLNMEQVSLAVDRTLNRYSFVGEKAACLGLSQD